MPIGDRMQRNFQTVWDLVLCTASTITVPIINTFSVRLLFALALCPVYIFSKLIVLVVPASSRSYLLFSRAGRQRLLDATDEYRRQEMQRSAEQLAGKFHFQPEQLLPSGRSRGKIDKIQWTPQREIFEVEGAQVAVVHEQPGVGEFRTGKVILLLHGNPSWSFMWRNVITALVKQGHEVLALDWIGHGASDKPLEASLITFSLHMRTLMQCIHHFRLKQCYIVAHDWGGAVALCTLPKLPPDTCSGIFLLDTFFPPRPTDINLHYILLYWIWFFSTGILDGYLPESLVMRFMCPRATSAVISGYSAPFAAGPKSRVSVGRFAHIVPGIPRWIMRLRSNPLWKVVEGLIGPANFTNVNAQAELAKIDEDARQWWNERDSPTKGRKPGVAVVFGEDDPLLKDFKRVLELTFNRNYRDLLLMSRWIPGAGHYPVEERPKVISEQIDEFVRMP